MVHRPHFACLRVKDGDPLQSPYRACHEVDHRGLGKDPVLEIAPLEWPRTQLQSVFEHGGHPRGEVRPALEVAPVERKKSASVCGNGDPRAALFLPPLVICERGGDLESPQESDSGSAREWEEYETARGALLNKYHANTKLPTPTTYSSPEHASQYSPALRFNPCARRALPAVGSGPAPPTPLRSGSMVHRPRFAKGGTPPKRVDDPPTALRKGWHAGDGWWKKERESPPKECAEGQPAAFASPCHR